MRPGQFVIIAGDMLERWTNGYLRSTPHRASVRPGCWFGPFPEEILIRQRSRSRIERHLFRALEVGRAFLRRVPAPNEPEAFAHRVPRTRRDANSRPNGFVGRGSSRFCDRS